jgi:hypothetical protein
MSDDYPIIYKKKDQNAIDVPVDTSTFDGVLGPADVDVQSALETIDDLQIEATIFKATYDEPISATYLVTASGNTNVLLSEPDTFENASVIGVAINTGTTGFEGSVLSFGVYKDASLVFGINTPLYLGPGGLITDIAPTTGVQTRIGKSLGDGAILVNIDEPIIL